jgi:hypothetical protein
MKKIFIAITIILGIGLFLVNYALTMKIEEEIFSKIEKTKKDMSSGLGSLKINIKKEKVKCNGFITYNCTIDDPTFGMKGIKEEIVNAKTIYISDLNIFTSSKININIKNIKPIDESAIKVKKMFPLDFDFTFYQKENNLSKINIGIENSSLKFDFDTTLKSLKNKDTKIVRYKIDLTNKEIKDFIYEVYKESLQDQVPQIISLTNKILLGEESFEIKEKEIVLNGFSNMLSKATNKTNPEKEKLKIDTFLEKKNSTLTISAKNKTGISLNEMSISKESPLDHFVFVVEVK